MSNCILDLHVHSHYSDGTMSPETILHEAITKGVTLLAIADHNQLDGSIELVKHALGHPINVISGVELDSLYGDIDVHILAYDFDMTHEGFRDFVHENRACLDETSHRLIDKMSRHLALEGFHMDAYEAFDHTRHLGGWKALHFLKSFNLIDELMEGLAFYNDYECGYDQVAFKSVKAVCDLIHTAGGLAILAHPGVTFKDHPIEDVLQVMLTFGIDGIECYYPRHDETMTQKCVVFCKDNNLLITSGSDCHGGFGRTEIGEMGNKCDPDSFNIIKKRLKVKGVK